MPWHQLALPFNGSTTTLSVDGSTVSTLTDAAYSAGKVGLFSGGYTAGDQFADLSITPTSIVVQAHRKTTARNPGRSHEMRYRKRAGEGTKPPAVWSRPLVWLSALGLISPAVYTGEAVVAPVVAHAAV
jgi:hypothetical protein